MESFTSKFEKFEKICKELSENFASKMRYANKEHLNKIEHKFEKILKSSKKYHQVISKIY